MKQKYSFQAKYIELRRCNTYAWRRMQEMFLQSLWRVGVSLDQGHAGLSQISVSFNSTYVTPVHTKRNVRKSRAHKFHVPRECRQPSGKPLRNVGCFD